MESSPHTAPPPGDELLPTRPSLLARLRNHDDSKSWHRGWEEFYLSYHPVLYRHALKHGLSDADAADVVQEIVIGLARSLPQYQYAPARSSFKTWLFRVAHNKVVDQLRKLKRQRRGRVENDGNENREAQTEVADENALTPDRAWDLTWETNLRRAALEQMIALPEGRREEPRRLLQSLYTSEADLVPDLAAGTLTVRVVHPANPLLARALEPLCTQLTQTQTEFPTTPLRMVFTLASSEPGATQNPRDRGS